MDMVQIPNYGIGTKQSGILSTNFNACNIVSLIKSTTK